MFVSFLLAGRFLEMSARHRAAEALEDTLSACRRRPFAWWDRMMRSRPSACCGWQGGSGAGARGGGLSCRRPVGGGSTQADESLLTGESRPVDKRAGDEVVAGSMNLSAPVTMQVERVGRTPGTRPSWP
jgi:Cu2+-exporting ATPase